MNILLIEDDKPIAQYISKGFREAGHNVEWADNGRTGFTLAVEHPFDVCIVDRMLPELDGLAIIKGLRAINNSVPIIILSALSDVDERVNGLTSGADDYLVKPFAFSELAARVNILANRPKASQVNDSTTLEFQDITLNLITREVSVNSSIIELKNKEFSLLEALIRQPSRAFSRTMLMEKVWGYNFDTHTNVIDVHISNLRKKIESVSTQCVIKTLRGVGYTLEKANHE
ncbi:response regulator transcription factor [Pseudoalteromonas umbrosa]|uniref:response regulator transcription factor n=1 Tax=Pseudoalteromonas umbrosa TaxID=3048489 RepID=UPI0024C2B660|nr:response regulator transcription factor [Pseudoalteromonas sp. B95]MDK1289839.1 response regulator transcription factor [Pseudoalteromonas sp. B95]